MEFEGGLLATYHHGNESSDTTLFSINAVNGWWRSGNAMCQISEVALRRAWLVLGWVTVCGQVNQLGTKPAS